MPSRSSRKRRSRALLSSDFPLVVADPFPIHAGLERLNVLQYRGVSRVENKSDSTMNRARVYFHNGEELSIIFGNGSYGYEHGLFEIQCADRFHDGQDLKHVSGGIRGYLTAEQVVQYIQKIASCD